MQPMPAEQTNSSPEAANTAGTSSTAQNSKPDDAQSKKSASGNDAGRQDEKSQKPARPDGLDDKYFDAEKGEVRWGDLTKDFKDTAQRLAEHDARRLQVPEKPEGYEFKLPDDVVKAFKEANNGVEPRLKDPNNPIIGELQAFAHEVGMTPEQYSRALALGVKLEQGLNGDAAAHAKKELEGLGPKAAARIDNVRKWANIVGGEDADYVAPWTAGAVRWFEKAMDAFSKQGSTNLGGREDRETKEQTTQDRAKMTPAERIHQAHLKRQAERAEKQDSGRGRR